MYYVCRSCIIIRLSVCVCWICFFAELCLLLYVSSKLKKTSVLDKCEGFGFLVAASRLCDHDHRRVVGLIVSLLALLSTNT